MAAIALVLGRIAHRRAREQTASPPPPEPARRPDLDLDWVPFRAACPEQVDATVELFMRGMERSAERRT
jgi:hypothetical protein